ncbi:MAG: ATP-grasp domain-containing protein [Desulfarculaceae bacterium]|nr:ATP-grasp domain-containing protein [Desulfarculaceae bacterium]MCF8073953.1 ATP-grasp domain-containing protein [Desulfarculaceae bacterium]MCF8102639.1 ATP-grasp domain-containing protein [Desulfarculaceae bacterium]MCF8117592.1 ATP-grasp domain-containing protein [Desulfarculaceae bacterium]
MTQPLVAIGRRLARYPQFLTLGPRPNLDDYPPEHLELIRQADTVFYPTELLAPQLAALGKRLFPSLACHLLEGDKIKQTTLFKLLGLPHPRTRVFYGRQRQTILDHFSFPFVAKKPRASSRGRGVFLIENQDQLSAYLAGNKVAYIQERLPIERDLRVVVIGFEPVCAYWRLPPEGEWRSNLAQGALVSFDNVPPAAVELAVHAARAADLDEVGLDLAVVSGEPLLLEFNVKYGRQGPALAGIDVVDYVARGILAKRLPPARSDT